MDKVLIFHVHKCTACGLCESICSLVHTQMCNPARSRIRISRTEPQGVYIPMFCQQCEDAPCIESCPSVAIGRSAATGVLEIDRGLCSLCEACIAACPYKGIYRDDSAEVVIACDLCGGDPNCVRTCQTKAIEFVEQDAAVAQKKEETLQEWRQLITAVEQSFQIDSK